MAEIKVLVEGYAKELEDGWVASSTVCLIIADGRKIITDPGCNREKLSEALKREKLATGDIDYVFLSHCHLDHILLSGIFEKAKFVAYDGNRIFDKDRLFPFDDRVFGDDVDIVRTPGHVMEHLALLVRTPQGKVAVAGDVIWWTDDEKQTVDINKKDHPDASEDDMEKLIASRKKLLELADYIIPGHGKMFKVEK